MHFILTLYFYILMVLPITSCYVSTQHWRFGCYNECGFFVIGRKRLRLCVLCMIVWSIYYIHIYRPIYVWFRWISVFKGCCEREGGREVRILEESNVYWTVHHCNSWGMKTQLDITCYFISLNYALNMFRTLIYPSSGDGDCVDELPHRSSCSVKTDDLALV